MIKRTITCCFMLVALAGPALAEKPAVKHVTVPFDMLVTKHIVVMIKVNGHGPYRVIFDTGAPISLLNTKVAMESGVMTKKAAQPSLFNVFDAMGQTKIKSVEIGGLKVENTSVFVMNHPTLDLISKVLGPVEGIVGFPLFARFKLVLDYQAKEMTFTPNGFEPPDAIQGILTTVMAMAQDKPVAPKVLAPSGQWGLVLQKEAGDEEAGVTIRDVLAGSAAAEAGLKAGDRLLTLDGRWTDTIPDTYKSAGVVKSGSAVAVRVLRDGKEVEIKLTPRTGI